MKISSLALVAAALTTTSLCGCETVNKAQARFLARPAPCEAIQVPIYFRDKSDALTDAALQAIHASAVRAKDCKVAAISVIGLADAGARAEQSIGLADRRGKVVADALIAQGFPPPMVEGASPIPATARRAPADPSRSRAEIDISFVH